MSFVRLYFMELDSSDDNYDDWSTEGGVGGGGDGGEDLCIGSSKQKWQT
jgi:hypothetical protein